MCVFSAPDIRAKNTFRRCGGGCIQKVRALAMKRAFYIWIGASLRDDGEH